MSADRALLTVLFTDIVQSTRHAAELGDRKWRALLDRHDALVRSTLRENGGREIRSMGDGFVAVFDTPVRAINAARMISERVQSLGLEVRGGIHTGECEIRGEDIGGIAVHVAARIATLAGPSEVFVSSTVRDLAAGTDNRFAPRGSHALAGVPRKWRVFSAEPITPADENSLAGSRGGKSPAKRGGGTAKRPGARGKASRSDVTVLLVDDHPLWRASLKMVLEHTDGVRVVAEAADGLEALEQSRGSKPQVVVMDVDMPSMNGIETTLRLSQELPDVKVLMLSSSDLKDNVISAIRAGASGYMLKTAEASEIAKAVVRIGSGELVFPPRLSPLVLSAARGDLSAEPSPSVALASDSLVAAEGLTRLVGNEGFPVVAPACRPSELPAVLDAHRADVVVFDVGRRFVEAATTSVLIQSIQDRPDPPAVLVLASHADAGSLEKLSHGRGGFGLLLKETIEEAGELGATIRRIAAGETVLDHQLASRLVARRERQSRVEQLTEREREVLALMAEGRSNQAISGRLHVSPKTLEGYVSSIFQKLGLEGTASDHRRVLAVVAYLQSV